MLSKLNRGSIWGLIGATAFCLTAAPQAFSAAKVKPEIPLGEETYEPAPATNHAAPAKAPKPSNTEKQESQSTAPTKDPHAKPPEAHGETPNSGAAHGEEAQSETTTTTPTSTESQTNQTLLEGKVAPASLQKGSGFIWFGVVFVLLAIAIFIFT